MKEIWRNFTGKLDADHQHGFILSETNTGKFQMESLSVWEDQPDTRYRFPKIKINFDRKDILCFLSEIEMDIENGRIPGEVFCRGRWRNPQALIDKYNDYHWRSHC